jgi:serine/threonine-protein kinase
MSDIKKYEPLWGTWYIETLLGEGGFGKVYKIRREEFGNTYYSAVKIIPIPQNNSELRQMQREGLDDAAIKEFLYALVTDIIKEINLMGQFKGNSHIVSLEDHQVIDRSAPVSRTTNYELQTATIGWDILMRMELLTSLTDHIGRTPPSPAGVVKLGIHMCRALELCALRNTVHRDIKPDNIFISAYGDYKLGDFGIARQLERTSSGLSKKGTYTYMAPEVFRGEQYGTSVDTYSLGLVMYCLLNQNRAPFLPGYPQPIMPHHRDEALQKRLSGLAVPKLKNVPAELNNIVLTACAYNRQERFASPTDICARPWKPWPRARAMPRRHRPYYRKFKTKQDKQDRQFSQKQAAQSTMPYRKPRPYRDKPAPGQTPCRLRLRRNKPASDQALCHHQPSPPHPPCPCTTLRRKTEPSL